MSDRFVTICIDAMYNELQFDREDGALAIKFDGSNMSDELCREGYEECRLLVFIDTDENDIRKIAGILNTWLEARQSAEPASGADAGAATSANRGS